ncbi:MAG: PVC-type heme-binding CxxCH protein [Pirellulales bacterium]
MSLLRGLRYADCHASRVAFLTVASTVALAVRALAQGYSPEEAPRRMQVADGFQVQLVAAEPLVRQPVAIEFDDRGRLWVIQYLQYPNPEGLQRVQVDRYSRTKYDRIPEPPPRGPRGADRITILEDVDGDGRMDRGRDFVAGLNLATGLAFGHGGVFVLNVPYLLFYPDRNRDDVPDSDPEVLLEGFGMEDAHSVANSLTFGPDGWLYGCQGSTVTADIRGVEFQQGVWRYHPTTRQFELFCEGGGNSWGLDFDRTGRLFYSTNYGGHVLLHGVQGGYFVKSFGKHGALHNPYAYGYFEHAPHDRFRGGHVSVGGIVYQGDLFPPEFRGRYIAGDLLGHGVYWHSIQPRGSSVQTAHGGELLVANDSWFAPTDVTLGPDGAVYAADWHDARTAHPDPDADWDRSNGRIYRLAPRNQAAVALAIAPVDFAQASVAQLLERHSHPSQWHVRKARQELVRRLHFGSDSDQAAVRSLRPTLEERATKHADETAALEALWTLDQISPLDEPLAHQLLHSPHVAVRVWTIRLLGDRRRLSDELAHTLDALAETEPAAAVRQQLACSAARFEPQHALPIINAHINRDISEDLQDPYLPLLWWWAVERHADAGREEVLKRFVRPTLWKSHLGRDVLLPRLARRYAAERKLDNLAALVRLLDAAPDAAAQAALWEPILQGWREQPRDKHSDDWQTDAWLTAARQHPFGVKALAAWRAAPATTPASLTLLQLCVALRHPDAIATAVGEAFDPQADANHRLALLESLRDAPDAAWELPAFALFAADQPIALRRAALQLLARLDSPSLPTKLLEWHRATPPSPLHASVCDVLLSRPASARAWLEAVDQGRLPASAASLEQIRRIALLNEPTLMPLVVKHWGRLEGATREEKLAEVRRLNNDLRAAAGDPMAGRMLFQKHCGVCHVLFGDGAKVGPDLTSANRQDRDFLLVSLVDPSSVIRKEYASLIVETQNGRVLAGLPVERTAAALTLVDAKGDRQTVATSDIAQLHESPRSLMPDDLYRQFKPQALRDLFAYLQSAQPVSPSDSTPR